MSNYPTEENPNSSSDHSSLDAHPRIPTRRPDEIIVNSRQTIASMRARPGVSRAFRR